MQIDQTFWRGKRVCVTGGTGLLGFQIVRLLVEAGARASVLALPPHPAHPLRGCREVEWHEGDIRDPGLVRRALGACDLIVHTAGVVAVWGPALRRVHPVHVEGTRHVLAAAPQGARVVHTSSVVTVGASRDGSLLTEESPFRLDRLKVDYVHAKREAERLALEAAAGGRDVVVTNPGYLVGPEDFERSVMGRFCRRYWRGQVPIAPPGGFSLVDARDAALGHLLAAEHGRAGRRYILGGENLTFPEFHARLAEAGGLAPRAVPVAPWWTLAALARLAEGRALVLREPPPLAVQQARLFRYHWFYRSERAEAELGYRCRPLTETLADTYCWCARWNRMDVRGASRWWMRPASRRDRAA